MPVDPLFLVVASFLVALLWAGLRMVGTKIVGLTFIFLSLGGLWALFQPTTPALLWGGEVAILGLCALYGWYIYEPAKRVELTEATPAMTTSATNQSVSVAGDRNTVFYNQTPTTNLEEDARARRREQTERIADFIEEGKRIQKLYRKPEGSLRNEVKVWLNRVRDYLQENFGRAVVTQWEDEEGLTPITAPSVMLLRDQKAFQVLSYRLTRLRELLTKLMDQQERL